MAEIGKPKREFPLIRWPMKMLSQNVKKLFSPKPLQDAISTFDKLRNVNKQFQEVKEQMVAHFGAKEFGLTMAPKRKGA